MSMKEFVEKIIKFRVTVFVSLDVKRGNAFDIALYPAFSPIKKCYMSKNVYTTAQSYYRERRANMTTNTTVESEQSEVTTEYPRRSCCGHEF